MIKKINKLILIGVLVLSLNFNVAHAGGVIDAVGDFFEGVYNTVENIVAGVIETAAGIVLSPSCIFGTNSDICNLSKDFMEAGSCRFSGETLSECFSSSGKLIYVVPSTGNVCAYSSTITFYNNAGLHSANEKNSKIRIYRFTGSSALSDQALTDWYINLRSSVGSGVTLLSNKELENYDLVGDHSGIACYGRDRNGIKNYCHASVADTDLLFEKDYGDICNAEGVCSFIDSTLPPNVTAAYVAKIVSDYAVPTNNNVTYSAEYTYSSGHGSGPASSGVAYNGGFIPVTFEKTGAGWSQSYKAFITVNGQKVYSSTAPSSISGQKAKIYFVISEPITSANVAYSANYTGNSASISSTGISQYNGGGNIPVSFEKSGNQFKGFITVNGQKLYSPTVIKTVGYGSGQNLSGKLDFVISEPITSVNVTYSANYTGNNVSISSVGISQYNGGGNIPVSFEKSGNQFKGFIMVNGQKLYSPTVIKTGGFGSGQKLSGKLDFVISEPITGANVTYSADYSISGGSSYSSAGIAYNGGNIPVSFEKVSANQSRAYIMINGQKIYSSTALARGGFGGAGGGTLDFVISEQFIKTKTLANKFLSTESGKEANFPILYADQQFFDKGTAVFGPLKTGPEQVCAQSPTAPQNVQITNCDTVNGVADARNTDNTCVKYINHGFKISWARPVSDGGSPISYKIYRGTSPDSLSAFIQTSNMRGAKDYTAVTAFLENRIQDPNQIYWYKVVAYNEKGETSSEPVSTEGLIVQNIVDNITISGAGFIIGSDVEVSLINQVSREEIACSGFVVTPTALTGGSCNITGADTGVFDVKVKTYVNGVLRNISTKQGGFTVTLPEPKAPSVTISDPSLNSGLIVDSIQGTDLYTGATVKLKVGDVEEPCFSLGTFDYETLSFPAGSCGIPSSILTAANGDPSRISIVISNDPNSLEKTLSTPALTFTGGYDPCAQGWMPDISTKCIGEIFTQSNILCTNLPTRSVSGTKVCASCSEGGVVYSTGETCYRNVDNCNGSWGHKLDKCYDGAWVTVDALQCPKTVSKQSDICGEAQE